MSFDFFTAPTPDARHAHASAYMHEVKQLHASLSLAGKPRNALLELPDDLTAYVCCLLRDEQPRRPSAPLSRWHELLEALSFHGVLPLLYWKLRQLPPAFRPPQQIIERLQRTFLASRARTLLMESHLRALSEAFRSRSLPVLFLKGPALAWSLYPDPAARPSEDIDLLVMPDSVVSVRHTLEALGYTCLERRFEHYRQTECEEIFLYGGARDRFMQVELHWNLLRCAGRVGSADVEECFLRSAPAGTPGPGVLSMHPVDALTFAAMHLCLKHGSSVRLIWIYDIGLLARGFSVPADWRLLQERCSQWQAGPAVQQALMMARVWTGLRLPDAFADVSQWPQTHEAGRLPCSAAPAQQDGVLGLFKAGWSRSPDLSAKLRYVFHQFFPHPRLMQLTYPPARSWMLPLAYLKRWWKWLTIMLS